MAGASGIVAVTSLAGVAVASLGLSTWRKQLKGSAEYELAKRLLLQVYKLRDAIQYVRQPFLSSAEAQGAQGDVPWQITAYENRWKGVREALIELQAALLESEVLWGNTVSEITAKLNPHIGLLHEAVFAFAESKRDQRYATEFTSEHRTTLYARGPSDAYNTGLQAIIGEFECYVRPHLKR
jgi:hypothetical protein